MAATGSGYGDRFRGGHGCGFRVVGATLARRSWSPDRGGTMTFDAAAYKATTKRQWDDAAEAWHRWGPTLEDWLGDSTEAMLDAAGVGGASHVLDVAGAAGGQAMVAARRTGPEGSVTVTDVSPTILTYAQRAADENGLRHVTSCEVDGEEIGSKWSEEFDAAISRLGLIY